MTPPRRSGKDRRDHLLVDRYAGLLLYAAIGCLPPAIGKIFHCGMYTYATEGVAPGSFDESDFKLAWTVSAHP